MNRNPALDQWLDDADHPLEAAIRAWCEWKDG
jgi:hypothetical protein